MWDPRRCSKSRTGSWRTHPQAMWTARSSPSMAPTGADQAQHHLLAPMRGTHNHHNPTCTRAHTLSSPGSQSWAACLATTSPSAVGTIPSFIPSVLLCLCCQLPAFSHQSSSLSLKPPRADNAIASPVPACTWGQTDPRYFCFCWIPKAPHGDTPHHADVPLSPSPLSAGGCGVSRGKWAMQT